MRKRGRLRTAERARRWAEHEALIRSGQRADAIMAKTAFRGGTAKRARLVKIFDEEELAKLYGDGK